MISTKRSNSEWMAIIQECRMSGMTDRAWCDANGISHNSFHSSVHRLKKLGVKVPEPRLLVTEQEIVRKSDEIRRTQIAGENADADGCYTVSQIAEMLQTTVKELNKRLVEEQVQFWNGGRYRLTEAYQKSGFAQDRSFHYYALDGEKKERK